MIQYYNIHVDVYIVMESQLTVLINPHRVGGGLQYLAGWFVCVYVCLLPRNCCLSSIISKSEHATALNLCKELAILLFYKTG